MVEDTGDAEVLRERPAYLPWLLLGIGVLILGMTALQLIRGRVPWSAALLALLIASAFVARRPVVIANREGIRLRGRRFTSWPEVAAVRPADENGWKHQMPSLVLKDGQRFGLEPLSSRQIDQLQRLLERFGDPPTGDEDSVPRGS